MLVYDCTSSTTQLIDSCYTTIFHYVFIWSSGVRCASNTLRGIKQFSVHVPYRSVCAVLGASYKIVEPKLPGVNSLQDFVCVKDRYIYRVNQYNVNYCIFTFVIPIRGSRVSDRY